MRFLGNIEAKTDAKGRVFLPATFRKVLQASGQEVMVMRKDAFQDCLTLYPESVWNEQLDMLRLRLNRYNRHHQEILRQFVSDAERIELDGNDKISAEHKLALCSTLAKQELQVFVSKDEVEMHRTPKANLFWDWINYLQKKEPLDPPEVQHNESTLTPQVCEFLESEGIRYQSCFAPGGIAVGPAIIDANNSRRFLAVVEDDCTTERFRESIEDREYIRPTILRQLGWKIINLWLPFWYMGEKDEKDHLITTIAIEQSVAPPPVETELNEEESVEDTQPALSTEQYQVVHPKIDGTPHDKPIAELPATSIISQLKFYVDHESPIHEELLFQRLLELHHVDRAGPMILKAMNDAIKAGIQKQRFIKTGKFFYSTKNMPAVLRDRRSRPDSERKFQYVAPEERALLPSSMDEQAIKQALGLLE